MVEDAQIAMRTLSNQGVAELEFSQEGDSSYVFAGLMADRQAADTNGGEEDAERVRKHAAAKASRDL